MPDKSRLHFLDSLRGLAAIYVVFFHTHLVPQPNPRIDDWLSRHFVDFGGTGVLLFFLISGFSLSLTMGRHERTGHPATSYAVSRLFRILPLFYVLLIATILRDAVAFDRVPSGATVALNLASAFNFFPGKQEGIVWASWTIGVEMLFYAMFLPLYRSTLKVQAAVCVAAIAGLVVLGMFATPTYVYFSFVGYVPLFVIGMWCFPLYTKLRGNRRLAIVLAVCGLALLIACSIPPYDPHALALRFPAGIGYAMILVASGVIAPKILEWRVLRFYGKISYSLYLAHPMVIVALASVFPVINAPGDLAYWLSALLVLSVTTAVAWLLYEWIERPGERLGKAVFARLGETMRVPAKG